MDNKYYLAVDIGASSGRHMLCHLEDHKMVLEEIYRFSNGMTEKNGHKVWDIRRLSDEIKEGMKRCAQLGKIPYSMGIDTWAVDYVLLDENDKVLGDAYAYRDVRTQAMDQEVYRYISEDELYQKTGIQKQIFNTIYQLMAVKVKAPEIVAKARDMLMIPDYFHFLLTGNKVQEYTNATTTQLVDPITKDWNREFIEKLGFPQEIFKEIKKPGYEVGELTVDIQGQVGFNCKVVLPPTHDTASAVLAVPTQDDRPLYISSGTWSLMGTELKEAKCSAMSMKKNLTNEGGYDYRFRYLKNIMGLWMIQSVKREIAPDMGFGELCDLAAKADISSVVDANDERFLAPESMTKEVKKACMESAQQVPQTTAEIAAVIYKSLAQCYAKTIEELEAITETKFDCIHIVGGGANAKYLNELTAKATKKTIYAGPTEATAVGNIASQMIAAGELFDLKEARKSIFNSFEIKQYTPD